MKALQVTKHKKYTLDYVTLQEVATPKMAQHQVMVRLRAAAFNPVDLHIISGEMALMSPRKPPFTLGVDGSGVIETVGEKVSNFKVGDEVFFYTGLVWCGTMAELIAVDAESCAKKPNSLTHPQAAAGALALLCAYKSLERAGTKAGDRVLIHGGGGSVGSAAVWMASLRGALVVATGNIADAHWVRSLGARAYYDYSKIPTHTIPTGFDMVLDGMGGEVFDSSVPLVKRGGTLVSLKVMTGVEDMQRQGMKIGTILRFLMSLMFRSKINLAKKAGIRLIGLATYPDGAELTTLAQLVDLHHFVPRIDQSFPLVEAEEALQHFQTVKPRGKVVVVMTP